MLFQQEINAGNITDYACFPIPTTCDYHNIAAQRIGKTDGFECLNYSYVKIAKFDFNDFFNWLLRMIHLRKEFYLAPLPRIIIFIVLSSM
jgi:hypothetical protein